MQEFKEKIWDWRKLYKQSSEESFGLWWNSFIFRLRPESVNFQNTKLALDNVM